VKRTLPRFWLATAAVLLLIEAFLLIAFFDAREAHQANVDAGCRGDDCFETGFDVVFWLFWIFVWPLLCPALALGGRWLWRKMRRSSAAALSIRTVARPRVRR
jgi:hypothetical protein